METNLKIDLNFNTEFKICESIDTTIFTVHSHFHELTNDEKYKFLHGLIDYATNETNYFKFS